MRVFMALKEDHPLVTEKHLCPICKKDFRVGERTMLVPIQTTEMTGILTVEAKPVHATCKLYGQETPLGIIERIKGGDGSPYPVITTDGKQYTLTEVGLND